MSSTKTPKGKAPAASYPHEDTITVSESRPPTRPFKSKGKNATRNSPTKSSSVAQTKLPSSSRAVDEGTPTYDVVEDANERTPVYDTVEDANDQLSDEGIQRLPDDLESAQREITALRAANQKLRQSVTPERGNYRKRHWPKRDTKSNSRERPHFHRRRPPSGPPSDNDSSSSDRSKHHFSRLSRKVNDPDKLDDGTDPTFKQWSDLMEGKLYRNRDHFDSDRDVMYYIYERTEGRARKLLSPRWGRKAFDPFVNSEDMLEWLTQHFTDPDEERKAKSAYDQLEQGTRPFHEFWSEFVELALTARIPRSSYKEDLWRKLNPTVRNNVSAIYDRVDYSELCRSLQTVDYAVQLSRQATQTRKAAKSTQAVTSTHVSQGPSRQRSSTPGVLPIRQSLPPVPERLKLTASTPPDQRQRSRTAENEDTCHHCGKTGHWAKECPEAPRHHIHEINELHPRVMEVDTDDEEAGEASQPENGDA